MYSTLRAALRAFKFAPGEFVLRASCPPPCGPHYVRSNSLPANLSNLFRFSFVAILSYKRSFTATFIFGWAGRITPGFLPSTLRAALRAFKFAPGEFVEPLSVLICCHSQLQTFIYSNVYIWLGREDYSGLPALHPAGRTACVQIRSRRICRTSFGSHLLPFSATNVHLQQRLYLAGPGGFEPPHARIKTWCLTAWRRPNIITLSSVTSTLWHAKTHARIPSS